MRKHIAVLAVATALAFCSLAAPRAGGQVCPPGSMAYGHSLTEWMQIYWTWAYMGGPDKVRNVQLLPLPAGVLISGSGTAADPVVSEGHLDFTMKPGTPFVLPVFAWLGERYAPETLYPDDPAVPAELLMEPPAGIPTRVFVDGKTVMDSTVKSIAPFYYGPAPLDITYAAPTYYGSVGAIFAQGIGFVHPPLSVGVHTIELESGSVLPPLASYLNLDVYPEGVGMHYRNTWTIIVVPPGKGK